MIWIFDIDGTLADISHRLHHIQKESKDWKAFFEDCADDSPISSVLAVNSALAKTGATILLVTGRSDAIEEKTLDWLLKYEAKFAAVYMRKEGDHREDHVVKAQLLKEIEEDWREELPILGVFEDRKQVVDMYRSRGLRVFQVAEGNF